MIWPQKCRSKVEKYCVKKDLGQKNVFLKRFRSKNCFGPKKILAQKTFCQEFLGQKVFGSKKIVSTKIRAPKIGSKK